MSIYAKSAGVVFAMLMSCSAFSDQDYITSDSKIEQTIWDAVHEEIPILCMHTKGFSSEDQCHEEMFQLYRLRFYWFYQEGMYSGMLDGNHGEVR